MKIIFPEITENPLASQAASHFTDIDFIAAPDLTTAVSLLRDGRADSMLSGLDYSSRDVLLAYKAGLPLKSQFFSSCFVCEKSGAPHYVLADGGVNKSPSEHQLYTITEDSAKTYAAFYSATPKIAMLSYSTHGSGGKNPDLYKVQFVLQKIRQNHPDWLIDGELQLDAAIIPAVARKKFSCDSLVNISEDHCRVRPTSQENPQANSSEESLQSQVNISEDPLQGQANVLIVPDLNSGNIMYKTMEHLGGWTMAGPIIQGFAHPITGAALPLADLSRGSSLGDTILTIQVIQKLHERSLS